MVTLHQQRKKSKVKYIEYDIDELNHIIYNNLKTPLIKEDEKINWCVDKMLYEGEQAKKIKQALSGFHFVTSFGRVLNAKQVKQLKMQNVRKEFLAVFLDGQRVHLQDMMHEAGFDYDYEDIINKYKEYKVETRWVKG